MTMSEDQPVLAMEVSDAVFVQWMRENLDRAARHFAVSLTGEPAFGWRLRTIGAQASGSGGARWLRVVTDYPKWARGDGWIGNLDANQLTGSSEAPGGRRDRVGGRRPPAARGAAPGQSSMRLRAGDSQSGAEMVGVRACGRLRR